MSHSILQVQELRWSRAYQQLVPQHGVGAEGGGGRIGLGAGLRSPYICCLDQHMIFWDSAQHFH